MSKVAPLVKEKGLEFKVEYVNSIRDWPSAMPKISTMYGAYRRRNIRDEDIVPHSFTFIRRESAWANWANCLCFCQLSTVLFFCEFLTYFLFQITVDFACWGMPASLLQDAEERLPSWYTKDNKDVFVLIKAFVSDQDLSQPPLLVLPGCKIEDMVTAMYSVAERSATCDLLRTR